MSEVEKLPVWLEKLDLVKFRNLEPSCLKFADRFNVFVGKNAQGKTSLLEAIYLLSTSQVLRASRDTEAIQDGSTESLVKGTIQPSESEVGIELNIGKRKRALINGVGLPRASDLIGRLPSVCFWSGDLALATGDPSFRRLLMDTELSQVFPGYLKAFSLYKRALQQRNALLKLAQEQRTDETLFLVWEQQMADSGEQLRQYRMNWVESIAPQAKSVHSSMSQVENLDLNYIIKDPGDLHQQLSQQRHREIMRGSTLFGPHRDDLEILINGKNIRQFGSQGQQRTAIISIKLAVLYVAQDSLGFPPLLLLDDIFSDLDFERRLKLVEAALTAGGQVFITCTEHDQAGDSLMQLAKIFRVESGVVREE